METESKKNFSIKNIVFWIVRLLIAAIFSLGYLSHNLKRAEDKRKANYIADVSSELEKSISTNNLENLKNKNFAYDQWSKKIDNHIKNATEIHQYYQTKISNLPTLNIQEAIKTLGNIKAMKNNDLERCRLLIEYFQTINRYIIQNSNHLDKSSQERLQEMHSLITEIGIYETKVTDFYDFIIDNYSKFKLNENNLIDVTDDDLVKQEELREKFLSLYNDYYEGLKKIDNSIAKIRQSALTRITKTKSEMKDYL